MARVSRLQAFSPVHVNSAWMAVGAYPATRADVENPQVRKGANDEFTMRKLDDNEVKARRLMAVLEERELAQVVRDAGLWEGVDRGAQRHLEARRRQSRVEARGGVHQGSSIRLHWCVLFFRAIDMPIGAAACHTFFLCYVFLCFFFLVVCVC